jgi:hypothetical protein
VYERNLYKEISQSSNGKKKRNLVVKANHYLDSSMNRQANRSASPGPNEIIKEEKTSDSPKKLPHLKQSLAGSSSTPQLNGSTIQD